MCFCVHVQLPFRSYYYDVLKCVYLKHVLFHPYIEHHNLYMRIHKLHSFVQVGWSCLYQQQLMFGIVVPEVSARWQAPSATFNEKTSPACLSRDLLLALDLIILRILFCLYLHCLFLVSYLRVRHYCLFTRTRDAFISFLLPTLLSSGLEQRL